MPRYTALALGSLIVALALAGCASRPAAEVPTPTAPQAATAAPPTAAPPTAAPPTQPPSATAAPPTQPPTAAPTQAPAATAAPATQAPTAAPTVAANPVGAQILFLRGGNLVALEPGSGQVRPLVEGVREFAATADGRRLALLRGAGEAAELWVFERATGALWQLTSNGRIESTPSWAPDGQRLVYTSAPAPRPFPPDWPSWSAWCAGAEARILALPAAAQPVAPADERTLAPGCEPAFGPDGKRIVFATPPTGDGAGNSLRMVNQQGANGWDMALADGVSPEQGQLVYSPAWSPDGGQISFQRFLGYQVLVDINMVETGSSYQRQSAPVGMGAGWMLPPRYAPSGGMLLITEHNFSDARGLTGYGIWRTSMLRLGQQSSLAMPSGELTVGATEVWRLPLATAAAWSPDSSVLVALLPSGWQPGAAVDDPRFAGSGSGELWRVSAAGQPETRLADGVDFGSALLWLPALP